MFLFLNLVLILLLKDTVGLFVEVGNYPDHVKDDLNLPECGVGFVGRIARISFEKKCFANKYQNTSFLMKNSQKVRKQGMERIFQGTDAKLGDAPWIVRLRIRLNASLNFVCSGSLITFEWVVTSAHCFKNLQQNSRVYVFAGSIVTRKAKEVREANVRKLVRHPIYLNESHYDRQTRNAHDIALIKLYTKFTRQLNDGIHYLINAVCLPNASNLNTNEDLAVSTGFGDIDINGTTPEFLQKADVRLIPYQGCPIHMMICAVQNGTDMKGCPGDSGGPLVQYSGRDLHQAILIGIFKGKRRNETCEPSLTVGYWVPPMRVIPWILSSLSGHK